MHGVPVRVPVVKESTALGAAICAGLGAGIYALARATPTGSSASSAPSSRTRTPSAAYEDLYPAWLEAYERLLELAADGVVRPLWRAAGT